MEARLLIVTDTPPDELSDLVHQYVKNEYIAAKINQVDLDEVRHIVENLPTRPYGTCRWLGASGFPFAADYIPCNKPEKLYAYIVELEATHEDTATRVTMRGLEDRLLRLGWCLSTILPRG